MPKISIIGAGAAGCFCAANLAQMLPHADIEVYESGNRPLAKVAITGGGRCNLTNSFRHAADLREIYPRGYNAMRRALGSFGWKDTWKWFSERGVALVEQDDGCIFPLSQDAMEIVRCLLRSMEKGGVKIRTGMKISSLARGAESGFILASADGTVMETDIAVVTTGGSPNPSGMSFLDPLGLDKAAPAPSLFTFCIDSPIKALMGTVTEVEVSLRGTRFSTCGPLLVTDWGMSGPAILKLSSYAARHLAGNDWKGELCVNWLPNCDTSMLRDELAALAADNLRKNLSNVHPDSLPSRLWTFLLAKAGLREDLRCGELGSKGLARLADILHSDFYPITGKAAFKDEFVTCGGVSLGEINSQTFGSKKFPGLYFAGEVLDIDAITGGYNLQAAWSTAYAVANSICKLQ